MRLGKNKSFLLRSPPPLPATVVERLPFEMPLIPANVMLVEVPEKAVADPPIADAVVTPDEAAAAVPSAVTPS